MGKLIAVGKVINLHERFPEIRKEWERRQREATEELINPFREIEAWERLAQRMRELNTEETRKQ